MQIIVDLPDQIDDRRGRCAAIVDTAYTAGAHVTVVPSPVPSVRSSLVQDFAAGGVLPQLDGGSQGHGVTEADETAVHSPPAGTPSLSGITDDGPRRGARRREAAPNI